MNYALSTPLSRLLRPGLAVAVHGTADDLGTTLDPFNHTEQETLPVIDNPEDRRVTEVRALGRYAHELKLHRETDRTMPAFSTRVGSVPSRPGARTK